MTSEEKMLWDYIDEESNDMLLNLVKHIEADGYDKAPASSGTEAVALKILSAAIVKTLAIATEKHGNYDLVKAYMDMVPMHVELIKVYTFKSLERQLKS
jgi:hypothetical protein